MRKKLKPKAKRGKPKRKEPKMVTHRSSRHDEAEPVEAETTEASTPSKTKDHDTQSPLRALAAIDDQIRATTGGEPGAGLYGLLNLVAGQFLGVPRSAMPVAPAAKDNAN
jgi:hypothetical protein